MSTNDSVQKSDARSIVIVDAVPVSTTQPIVNETTVVQGYPERTPRTDLERVGLETQEIGVCRRCRRQFRRPAGVNDGQAAFYRCSECVGLKFEDIVNSCTIF